MNEALALLEQGQLDLTQARQRVYRAPTPRERERWHALWLLAAGGPAAQVAQALERDAHTISTGSMRRIGAWLNAFREAGPASLTFEPPGGSPPPSAQRNKPR